MCITRFMSFEICHTLCSALTIKFSRTKWITLVFLGSPLTLTEVFVTLIAVFCFLAFKNSINRSGGVLSYQDFIFSNIQDALTLSASHIKADLEKRGFSPHSQYLNHYYPTQTSIV